MSGSIGSVSRRQDFHCGSNLMRLCERRKMPNGPRHYVAIAMQVAFAPCGRAQYLRDITRDRRLLGQNGHYPGFPCRVAQITSLVFGRGVLLLLAVTLARIGQPLYHFWDSAQRFRATTRRDDSAQTGSEAK